MGYPKKLLRLKPIKGIAADTPPHEVGPQFYTNGRNVQFRRGFASRIMGNREVYGTLPVDAFRLLNALMDGVNYWLVFGADEIHALETVNATNVTPAGGLTAITQPWEWAATLLNGVPVATNGIEAPHYWDGNTTNDFVELPDWPAGTSCKSIVAFRFHLFALDIDGPGGHFDSQILWSDAAAPGAVPSSWTPTAANEAGDAQLGDTPGPVLMGLPLRGSLMLYKPHSTYSVDYVGGNEKFSLRTLFTSSGALTRHAACDVNGQHLVVSDGDIILTDGTNRRSIGQARMKDFLFSQLDQDNYENLFSIYYPARGEVWVCFPESGETLATLALVYDVANDAFGIRELPDVAAAAVGIVNDAVVSDAWDDDSDAWESDSSGWNTANFSAASSSLVLGAGDLMILQDTQDAVSLAASLGRHDLTFGAPERVKFVKRLHVLSESSGPLFVRIGARMTPGDSTAWSPEVELTSPDQIVNTFAQGRYISVELRSEAASTWTVTGIEIEAELRGYH